MMDFTFGIITDFKNESKLSNLISSIENQKINNYQIILVGSKERKSIDNLYSLNPKINIIDFDETKKEGWITKKKNLITNNAIYENIVYLHDYLLLDNEWYSGFERFGNSFDICMNKISNLDGSRYRDWCLSPQNFKNIDKILKKNLEYLLPYSEVELSRYMYISGAYWVAKKSVMTKYPLNENLSWGDGEDIEWSHRVRDKHNFKFNEYSVVKLQKSKDVIMNEISDENLELFKKLESKIYFQLLDNALAGFRRSIFLLSKKLKYLRTKLNFF